MKHVHAEVIHAFADGAKVEKKINGEWKYCAFPDFDRDGEYRIEPAAPKWPQTTMTIKEINGAIANGPLELVSFGATETARRVINKAIEHECSTGALVPADKVREIEAKAREEGKRDAANPVRVIEATWNHMKLGRLDPETIQIILLKAATK